MMLPSLYSSICNRSSRSVGSKRPFRCHRCNTCTNGHASGVRRNEWCDHGRSAAGNLFHEAVAEPDDGFDLRAGGTKLGAKSADMDVDGARFDVSLVTPDALEE